MGIAELRAEIDGLDDQILDLLNRRAQKAREIGELKAKNVGKAPAFFDPERELRVLKRLQSASQGPFPSHAVPYVFREVISACRSLETPMRIAYLGPPGTYTQIAATRAFGNSAEYLEAATIRGVFEAVERGQAQFGVVPLENSGEGGVRQTLQAFQDSELRIRSEAVHRIEHCLVSNAAELGAIERVYSHPQALSQCRRWIHENLPRAALLESDSTAAAARLASQDMSSAAVASKLSAELLGLGLLREGIQDQQGNATRFVVVGAEDAPRTGHDRTSFLCVLRHAPGALKAVVDAFVTRGLEISRFESHPHPQEKWRHHYFVDFLGHRSEPQVAEALGEAAEQCLEFKVLGSYPFGLGDGA